MQIYQFFFDLLTGIMELGVADLSIEEIFQMYTECSFLTQCCTASALCCVVYTALDIHLFKERINQSIGKSVIKINPKSKGEEIEI